ncbi:pimeloyl-ACP methyl ester esterase BioH [Paraglaciecola sp. L3A3]|uniref:pimeloyl-ACP methyl ester esterase BioH n=1 Tax=Paraglaciecola sp. L3A3 TaxID=2686358 RepID=UPI00131C7D11|nr:pimeloyl-ACP methyl ester esterase BioH [Paraglaciecola sp. L3A3]
MSVKLNFSSVGQGKNLVLLHGWGVNSGVWQALIPYLQNEYRVTTIDIPGFGLNHNVLPEPYDLDTLAQCIAQQLPTDCLLLGWSLGGLIAQQIALSYPEKVQQLLLVCSSPKFSRSDDWPGIDPKVLTLFAKQLEHDFSKTLERFLAIQAMGSESARQDVKKIKTAIQQYPNPSAKALVEGLNLLNQCDLREQLKGLSVPCHIFLGRLDTLVPVKIAPLLSGLSKRIQTTILVKSSHAPFISATEHFAQSLKQILKIG